MINDHSDNHKGGDSDGDANGVEVDDTDDADENDDDLYIIGAVCLFVCHKSHYFRIQRIWSFVSFIASFRTQRNWSFPCFLTFCSRKCLETVKQQNPLKYSKNLVNSPVSGHFPY